MVDFNSDIPKGKPQVDPSFFKPAQKNEEQNPIFNENINYSFTKDFSKISIFGKDKK